MTPENGVKKSVLDLLAAEGIFGFRINTASFSADHKGKKRFFSAHSLGKGAADIYCTPPILAPWHVPTRPRPVDVDIKILGHLWIECKAPGGKQSEDQKRFQEWVIRKGHSYLLAFSSDDVVAWLREHGRYSL